MTPYQKGIFDGGSTQGLVESLPTMVATYGVGTGINGARMAAGITLTNADVGLVMALTTEEGYLFSSALVRSPISFNAQRFGLMSTSNADYWGLGLGNSNFVGRSLYAIWPSWNSLSLYTKGQVVKGTAIWPSWNSLSLYTKGQVVKGTPIIFGITGPQSFRYGLLGGVPQFQIFSNTIRNQKSTGR